MNIPKAKELLQLEMRLDSHNPDPDLQEARMLAIEALSAISAWRMRRGDNAMTRLPSETPVGDSHHTLT